MRAFRIAYDGRSYYGFQRQPDVPTVEDSILDALRRLEVLEEADTPPGYAAAGRTDAGVSALAQTVAFECPDWLSPAALNSELPEDIRAWASADAPEDFHATHHASARTYVYYLHAPDANRDAARAALDRLSGEHDFHNLTPDDTGTRRDLSAALSGEDSILELTFRAGGFPRQLVRRLVSLVAELACGEADTERIDHVLSAESLSGPEGVAPAPPYPLLLQAVEYPALSFEADPDAAPTAHDGFESRQHEHAVRARVAGEIADGIERSRQ